MIDIQRVIRSTHKYTGVHRTTSWYIIKNWGKTGQKLKFHKHQACGINIIRMKTMANSVDFLIWFSVPPSYHLGVILFLLIFP